MRIVTIRKVDSLSVNMVADEIDAIQYYISNRNTHANQLMNRAKFKIGETLLLELCARCSDALDENNEVDGK
jgi:hypothetical protein